MAKGHNSEWWDAHPEAKEKLRKARRGKPNPKLAGKPKSSTHKERLSTSVSKAFKKKREKGEHIGRRPSRIIQISQCNYCKKRYGHGCDEIGVYCSNDCRIDDVIYKGDNYRNKALHFLEHVCQYCGIELKPHEIIVHHIDEDRLNNHLSNLAISCTKCHSKLHKQRAELGRKFYGDARIQRGVREILLGMKLNIKNENFKATPQRVSRMYHEMFLGLYKQDELEELLTTSVFPSTYSGIIIHENILAFSMCPHHLLPVEYKITLGYISKHTIGLSKLPRFVELMAKRPVLQETLTNEIADSLMENLEATGAMVVVKGRHSCMRVRGVRTLTDTVTTSSVRGVFATEPSLRDEFASLLKFAKPFE